MQRKNNETNENHGIPKRNHENNENQRIPYDNHATHENFKIQCENYENHEDIRLPCDNKKKSRKSHRSIWESRKSYFFRISLEDQTINESYRIQF